MEIYFLDMGIKQYGDCIVLTANDKKILIDGAHPQDLSSIKMQLKKILMQDPPFHFDLLFVTHCHDDHIGCLPELIATGDVTAKKCILADPKFRWDEDGDSDSASDGLADALMEEDHSNLSDEELEVFLSDIEQLKVRYRRMIKTLQDDSDVTLFQGVNAHNFTSLYNEFSDFGLKIIGPTKEQLQITQDALGVGRDAIADFIDKVPAADSDISRVELYRRAFRTQAGDNEMLLDAPKNSGAINDQSIVIYVEAEGWKALLAGDMQFAEPNVTGLDSEMEKLLNKVYDSGPYDIVKTSHHTSDNGLDAPMLDRWIGEGTEFFVHSGGLKDDDHPDASVLQLLKARKSKISFARTDRNGLIKVAKDGSDLSLFLSKGRINNFTPNVETDEAETEEVTPAKGGAASALAKAKGAMVTTERVVNADAIHITAAIPSQLSKVTIIVEIEGGEKKKSVAER